MDDKTIERDSAEIARRVSEAVAPLEQRIAALTAERDRLAAALERCRTRFVQAVNRTPIRDMDETLAEVDAALTALANSPSTPEPVAEAAFRALVGSPCGTPKPKKEEK